MYKPNTASARQSMYQRDRAALKKDTSARRLILPSLQAELADPDIEVLLKRVATMALEEQAAKRSRQDLIPGVRLASERELPNYTPWSAKKIKALLKAGILKPLNAPSTGRKKKENWFNLYEVWEMLNKQSPGWKPCVRRIPDDLEVKLS